MRIGIIAFPAIGTESLIPSGYRVTATGVAQQDDVIRPRGNIVVLSLDVGLDRRITGPACLRCADGVHLITFLAFPGDKLVQFGLERSVGGIAVDQQNPGLQRGNDEIAVIREIGDLSFVNVGEGSAVSCIFRQFVTAWFIREIQRDLDVLIEPQLLGHQIILVGIDVDLDHAEIP